MWHRDRGGPDIRYPGGSVRMVGAGDGVAPTFCLTDATVGALELAVERLRQNGGQSGYYPGEKCGWAGN